MKPETKKVLEKIMSEIMYSGDAEYIKETVKKHIQEIYYIESPETKVGKVDLYKFVDTDKTHTKLIGVYYDPEGFKVASDGHVLAAIKSDFDESLSGKIINKKGEVIEERYPNWRMVVPDDKWTYPVKIDISEAADVCKKLGCMKKSEGRDYAVRIDGVCFEFKKFGLILSVMKELNTDIVRIGKDARALVVKGADGGIALMMPIEKWWAEENEDKIMDVNNIEKV